MRFDLPVPVPEELSRDELIVVVRRQAGQITAMAGQVSELVEVNETLAGKLARLEHLLSRNSGNSSNPPSKDDDSGQARTAGEEGTRRGWAEAKAGQTARRVGITSAVDRAPR